MGGADDTKRGYTSKPTGKATQRAERRAAALRANLRRRKAQSQARAGRSSASVDHNDKE